MVARGANDITFCLFIGKWLTEADLLNFFRLIDSLPYPLPNMNAEKSGQVQPEGTSQIPVSPVIEHDWAAKITQNPDGTITYEPTPETLPDGSENPMARAMRHMRIIMGER